MVIVIEKIKLRHPEQSEGSAPVVKPDKLLRHALQFEAKGKLM
ncbi:MAG: hypothetical protein NTZ80_01905 [Patescibacteria group bacterium]|nr:hypothetical protein [Patescibacteria group bacterium]